MLCYSEKINFTIIDAEINQSRTLISNRVGVFPKQIKIMPGKTKITGASLFKADI
ncbi:MAG: hypothetical protein SPL89_02840 [Clostridia bacterium]|nr:hypothetical protein [Clostridia bacterium]